MTTDASSRPDWLAQVRAGDFAAVPQRFEWSGSGALAHLIHGYDVAQVIGLGDLHAWANDRYEQAQRTGSWHGSAIELWLNLFHEHRRWRHFGYEPKGDDQALLDQLCRQLRDRLQNVSEGEGAAIRSHIAASASRSR